MTNPLYPSTLFRMAHGKYLIYFSFYENHIDEFFSRPMDYPRIPGHEVVGRIVNIGSGVDSSNLKIGALVGVGWSGGYCHSCGNCRKGDFAGCVTNQFTGFSFDGGHGEYMYAPETGE